MFLIFLVFKRTSTGAFCIQALCAFKAEVEGGRNIVRFSAFRFALFWWCGKRTTITSSFHDGQIYCRAKMLILAKVSLGTSPFRMNEEERNPVLIAMEGG